MYQPLQLTVTNNVFPHLQARQADPSSRRVQQCCLPGRKVGYAQHGSLSGHEDGRDGGGILKSDGSTGQ
jgi:hypothetical protein